MAAPMIDPGADALTSEGVERAEALAAQLYESMISLVGIAKLDTTITSCCLLAELLAGLEVFAGVNAKAAFAHVKGMAADRATLLRQALDEREAEEVEPPPPSASSLPTHRGTPGTVH